MVYIWIVTKVITKLEWKQLLVEIDCRLSILIQFSVSRRSWLIGFWFPGINKWRSHFRDEWTLVKPYIIANTSVLSWKQSECRFFTINIEAVCNEVSLFFAYKYWYKIPHTNTNELWLEPWIIQLILISKTHWRLLNKTLITIIGVKTLTVLFKAPLSFYPMIWSENAATGIILFVAGYP